MFDNHIHSEHSYDIPKGEGSTVREICLSAIEKGVKSVAITDHFDIDGIYDGYFPPLDHEAIYRDIMNAKEEFEGRVTVLHGIELGQPTHMPAEAHEQLKQYTYDIVLGSVHAVRGINDFSYADIKSMSVSEYTDLWDRYISEMLDTIEWGDFDVLTHITYPKRYYLANGITDFPDIKSKGREYFEPILQSVVDKGLTLECNSSGLRQIMGECLPNEDLFRFYYELGGRDVTLGSDSHHCRDISANFIEASEMLRSIGFKYITRFEKRQKYFDIL